MGGNSASDDLSDLFRFRVDRFGRRGRIERGGRLDWERRGDDEKGVRFHLF